MVHCDLKFLTDAISKAKDSLVEKTYQAFEQIENPEGPWKNFAGWYDYPQKNGFSELKAIKQYIAGLDEKYNLVLGIGIGGSYLGAQAAYEALTPRYITIKPSLNKNIKPLMFMGQDLSARSMQELLEVLDQYEPMVCVISKSGTTTEPAVAFRIIRAYMEKRYGDQAQNRIVAVTDKSKGALRQLSQKTGYKTFVVPDDIGGRFSVLTPVGLVPLALAGVDVESMMQGADQMFATMKDKNHAVHHYAAARQAAYAQGKKVEALSFSEPSLVKFGEWWKQLFGESEGKNRKGILPMSLLFTTDLHSMGQYAQDGERIIFETFLKFNQIPDAQLLVPSAEDDLDELSYLQMQPIQKINAAAMTATKIAHYDGGLPVIDLTFERLDAKTMGGMFAFFELACALSGIVSGVHPFDQPGVEDYKKNLFAMMGRKGFENLAARLKERL
jgi:glucose-6-phosphate isomerase